MMNTVSKKKKKVSMMKAGWPVTSSPCLMKEAEMLQIQRARLLRLVETRLKKGV